MPEVAWPVVAKLRIGSALRRLAQRSVWLVVLGWPASLRGWLDSLWH